jgi:hypothetical protein
VHIQVTAGRPDERRRRGRRGAGVARGERPPRRHLDVHARSPGGAGNRLAARRGVHRSHGRGPAPPLRHRPRLLGRGAGRPGRRGRGRGAAACVGIRLRALFKALFARGERYQDTGGIHAAALVESSDPEAPPAACLIAHAEDIGRHNAVDKSIGGALLAGRPVVGLGLLVTGRISAELAFKAARAGIAWVATPSVPSTLAVEIARRSGMVLVGRAVSGSPQQHGAPARARAEPLTAGE